MNKSFFLYPFILIIGMFLSYENPEIISNSKKIFKYFFGKEQVIIKPQKTIIIEKDKIEANSFDLKYQKVMEFEDRSASMLIDKKNNNDLINLFTSIGKIETAEKIEELPLPIDFYDHNNGGVRSVFKINETKFILVSNKIFDCYYASIVRVDDNQQIIKSECIPDADKDKINFSGLGGGYIDNGDTILLAIGTPTHAYEPIDKLSQNKNSIFGKILEINKKDLINLKIKKVDYEIFSLGHRNPQGLVKAEGKIYSLEHGPHGGDELNLIKKGKNYGWPIYSYGVPYEKKKKLLHHDSKENYISPIYTYLPAIAPSHIVNCPENLSTYYNENVCLLALSLKGMSLILILLDKKGKKVISSEKIFFEERLRHFGLNNQMKLFQDSNSSFYVASDDNNIYKLKFENFVK